MTLDEYEAMQRRPRPTALPAAHPHGITLCLANDFYMLSVPKPFGALFVGPLYLVVWLCCCSLHSMSV